MQTLIKTLNLLAPEERRQGAWVLLMVIGMAALETLGVAAVMPFLAILGNPEMVETNILLSTLFNAATLIGIDTVDRFLVATGGGAFVIIVVSAGYRMLTLYTMNRFVEMRRHSFSAKLLETYLRQPYEFFINRHSSDMTKTMLSEVDQLIQHVFRPGIVMVAYSIVLLFIFALLIIINPIVAIMAVATLGGIYALIYATVRSYLSQLGTARAKANKERFLAATEALGGIKDIKLLGCEESYLNRFESPSRRFAMTQASNQTLTLAPNYVVEAVAFGGIMLLTLILLMRYGGAESGALGQILPILGAYAFAAYRMRFAAQNIYSGFASLRYGAAAFDNVQADLQQRMRLAQIPNLRPEPLKVENKITLSKLSYTYPASQRQSLVDLDLEITVGTAVGIIGSTGAGKTTLVDVVLGLLRPTRGAIMVDGQPVDEQSLRAWQASLGYVPQDIFLTDTSLTENIAMGIPVSQINHERVMQCARMAQVHEFIMQELPHQYATLVGERGVRLSGGQRQRIGIARALYHDPAVLLFDEATSALDSVTEQAVMSAIDTLAEQKTVILIAHRLSTVRNCDLIIVMEQGRIIARGTYDELADSSETFKNLAGVEK